MNGVVELTVAALELEHAGQEATRVRVRAGAPNGDTVSIAVLVADAPAIGSTIRVRIDQADPAAPPPAGVLSNGEDP